MALVAIVVFGWPAVVASVVLTSCGIALRRPALALAGAIVAVPFMLYLFASPGARWIAPPVALAHFATPFALRRSGRGLAALLLLPFVLLAAYIATLVVRQFTG
jgi:hypothetical protein